MILDAGFLISVDRSEHAARVFLTAAARSETALHTTHPVVAQVWRQGSRQSRLAACLKTITIHPLDDGRAVGELLTRTRTADVVDAHLVITAARLNHDILTGDPRDLATPRRSTGPRLPHHPSLALTPRRRPPGGTPTPPSCRLVPCGRAGAGTPVLWSRHLTE